MATHYNFREIWSNKDADIPNVKEIKAKAERYRRKQMVKDKGVIIMMFLSACTVIGGWIFARFSFFTTKLGMILLLIGVFSFIYLTYQKVNILKKVEMATTNQEYLALMKKAEQQQIYIQTIGLSFYYVILSSGFAFYFYEFALKMSWSGVLLVYGLTFVWAIVSWFIVRPWQIRKQRKKIAAVIESLEKLQKSFDE